MIVRLLDSQATMTQATEQLDAARNSDNRVIGAVGAAHFVSHYYYLLLPPLFVFVRDDYGVSYTEIGLALTAYNTASTILQTPAGFLVDRIGARLPLFAALLIGAFAFAVTALTDSFWLLLAMFTLGGVANAVYHPADYALLSNEVSDARVARAYSFHTFAGLLGSAVAPATLLLMQSHWGWRGAFLGAAALGIAVAPLVLMQPRETSLRRAAARRADGTADPAGWQLLLSAPILLNFVTFILLAMINAGLQNYSVVALGALYGTAPVTANAALTSYLAFAAAGVIAGGILAARTKHHAALAVAGLIVTAIAATGIVVGDPGSMLLIAIMGGIGFVTGGIMPSRDLLVRQIAPPGAIGTVFGFVTSGFNVAGVIAPVLFGLLMDHGLPALVFVLPAAFALLTVVTVAVQQIKFKA